MRMQARIGRVVSDELRIDDILYLGLPAPVKDSIRRESATRKMRMSPYIREKLGIKV